MTFPVPKDVRTARDFALIMGQDELLRNSRQLDDPTVNIDVGEWLKPAAANKMDKLDVGDTLAAPAKGAKVSWTLYRPGNAVTGQSDALATKSVDVLSGTYQAETKIYNSGSTFLQPGNILVAVWDAVNSRGQLDAPDPAALTVLHLAAAVGRIVSVDSGVLTFESPI